MACALTYLQTGAINYYAPTIFGGLGLSSTTTALFAQGVYGIVKTIGAICFVFFLADSIGRRFSMMWSGAVQAFAMLFVGFYVRYGPTLSAGSSPPPAGIAALAMIYLFALAFNAGWGPVAWVYGKSTFHHTGSVSEQVSSPCRPQSSPS